MQFVRNLQNTGRFSEVTITNLTRNIAGEESPETMSFSLAIRLKGG
jgi:hypothetical protein